MKNSALLAAAVMAAAFPFLFAAGCDRPEVPRSELGTVVGEYPDLPDRPAVLPLPEGVDSDCRVTKRANLLLENAKAQQKAAESPSEAKEAKSEETPSEK